MYTKDMPYTLLYMYYYTDRLSIWLSVDPLADKYPHLSPYAYCADNPVMLVDPDGNSVFPSAADLRAAGESVINDRKYFKKTNAEDKSTTYCNFAAQAIVVKGGHNRVKGTATEMVEFLQNKNNATTITQEQAQSFANAGVTVFAGYHKTNGEKNSHIAIVAPNEGRSDKTFKVFNAGAENGELTINRAFGARKVEYFILNEDIETITQNNTPFKLQEVSIEAQVPTRQQQLIDVKTAEITKNIVKEVNVE